MLVSIIIVLLALWIFGFGLAGAMFGNSVHILLIAAAIATVFQLLRPKRSY